MTPTRRYQLSSFSSFFSLTWLVQVALDGEILQIKETQARLEQFSRIVQKSANTLIYARILVNE